MARRRRKSTPAVSTAFRSDGSSTERPNSAFVLSDRCSPPSSEFAVVSDTPRFDEILIRLADEGVDLVVVGMVAAVIQGVPATTWDLDVVHRRSPDNVQRLLRVLRDLGAVARHDPRRIAPNETHLIGPGHVLLQTRLGDLDCLGAIDGGRSYEDLVSSSVEVDLAGHRLLILSLRELLEIKTRAGRPKDLAVIPYIRSTLREIESRER
jgi:hypothetical protein